MKNDKLVRLSGVLNVIEHTGNSMSGWLWEELHEDIQSLPAVDAVEMCRCADCVHFEPFRQHDGFCKIDGMLHENDFFCKYGERREDGEA